VTEGHRPSRLALGLYALAFVLLLVAGGILAAAVLDELQDTQRLWISAGVSGVAAVLALLALFLPRSASR